MSNHYKRLGVNQNATEQEIREAYKRLALLHHPDRRTGDEAQFKLIQAAYETLSDLTKRRAYDASLGNFFSFVERLARQGIHYSLPENPHQYDHYTYINKLLGLKGEEALEVGQDITDYVTLSEKLNYISHLLYKEESRLKKHPSPTKEMQARIAELVLHSKKIGSALCVFDEKPHKLLYDLSLDIAHTDEMKQIEALIGGRDGLIERIKNDQDINIANPIFYLRAVNLLTPTSFKQLTECDEDLVVDISLILGDLLRTGLLTQANFDCIMQHKKHALSISKGLSSLNKSGILNQFFFDIIISTAKQASDVGFNIGGLNASGMLNDANLHMVVSKVQGVGMRGIGIGSAMYDMKREGLIAQEQSDALLWKGPSELSSLNARLDEMIAHGVFLFTCDVEKGKTAMFLGLDLKKALKAFFEKTPEEQAATKAQFKTSFITKLHSKDNEMAAHRGRWKVIVANVLIALTGIGLFAIGVCYGLTGHCFFNQTLREKHIQALEEEARLVAGIN